MANESLIPFNLIKRPPETQNNTVTLNATPNQIKKYMKYSSVFRTKDFFQTDTNKKNMCKIVCKMQCLKSDQENNHNFSDKSIYLRLAFEIHCFHDQA